MPEIKDLLDLPLATISVLAAGYVGYRVAYIGRGRSLQAVDVVFLTLAFALVAKVSQYWTLPLVGEVGAALAGMAASIAVAFVWRVIGEKFWNVAQRLAGLSVYDRHETAWDTIRHRSDFGPGTIVVAMKNGWRYMSADAARFNVLQDGPYILGDDGSVAMFVTARSQAGSDDWDDLDPYFQDRGTELTYFPASEIAAIKVLTPR